MPVSRVRNVTTQMSSFDVIFQLWMIVLQMERGTDYKASMFFSAFG